MSSDKEILINSYSEARESFKALCEKALEEGRNEEALIMSKFALTMSLVIEGSRVMVEDLEKKLLPYITRQCVACGVRVPKEHNRSNSDPLCKSPEACTFDLTPDEAWEHWKTKYHELYEAHKSYRVKVAVFTRLSEDLVNDLYAHEGAEGFSQSTGELNLKYGQAKKELES